MKQNTIGNHFKPVVGVSEKEEELVKWIILIVDESLPLLVVESDSHCSFHGSKIHFGSKMIRATLLTMTEMVEAVIGKDMKLAGRGQAMCDSWIKNGVHFVDVFASHDRSVKRTVNRNIESIPVPKIVLLSCSPTIFKEVS